MWSLFYWKHLWILNVISICKEKNRSQLNSEFITFVQSDLKHKASPVLSPLTWALPEWGEFNQMILCKWNLSLDPLSQRDMEYWYGQKSVATLKCCYNWIHLYPFYQQLLTWCPCSPLSSLKTHPLMVTSWQLCVVFLETDNQSDLPLDDVTRAKRCTDVQDIYCTSKDSSLEEACFTS